LPVYKLNFVILNFEFCHV